jgi:hypothetical protein
MIKGKLTFSSNEVKTITSLCIAIKIKIIDLLIMVVNGLSLINGKFP